MKTLSTWKGFGFVLSHVRICYSVFVKRVGVKSLSCVSATLWTGQPARFLLSLGLSQEEQLSALAIPFSRRSSDLGMEPRSPA